MENTILTFQMVKLTFKINLHILRLDLFLKKTSHYLSIRGKLIILKGQNENETDYLFCTSTLKYQFLNCLLMNKHIFRFNKKVQ